MENAVIRLVFAVMLALPLLGATAAMAGTTVTTSSTTAHDSASTFSYTTSGTVSNYSSANCTGSAGCSLKANGKTTTVAPGSSGSVNKYGGSAFGSTHTH